MIVLKRSFFIILIIILLGNNAFGQKFRYLLKLFETKDEKYIALIEETHNKQLELLKITEEDKNYTYYRNVFKEEDKTEIVFSGIYRSRNEFLNMSFSSERKELKRSVQKIMSKGSKSGVEETHAINNFSKSGLLASTPSKLSEERRSLKKVTEAEVYFSIPETSQEFENIFQSPNNRQLVECIQIKEWIKNEENEKIHFLNNSNLLKADINNNSNTKPIIIIGHNKDGNICFPDGSKENIFEIDGLTNKTKRTIIYLSCNTNLLTNNPAPNYYLTYHDGIELTNRINHALLKNANLNIDNIQINKILNDIILTYGKEKKQKFHYKIATYSIVSSSIGYALYEIKQGDSK